MSYEDLERLVSKRKLMIDKRDEEIEALKAERDALAAQVDLLKDSINKCTIDNVALLRLSPELKQIVAATPQQCLRDVQAEAGRAGFAAGVYAVEIAQILGSHDFDAEKSADEYAESLSQGTA